MLTRVTRWFLIAAPAVAGLMLLIFGTDRLTSQAFGWTLIGIAAMVWLSNWFIRMSFGEKKFERESAEREERAAAQRVGRERPAQPPPVAPGSSPPSRPSPHPSPASRLPAARHQRQPSPRLSRRPRRPS